MTTELILGRGGGEQPKEGENPAGGGTAIPGVTCPLKSSTQVFPMPGPLSGQVEFQTVTGAANCRTDCALYRGSKDHGKPGECWLKVAARALSQGGAE